MSLATNALGPSQVNVQPAIGVAGDFASANPRFNLLSGSGAVVAGPGGLTVGNFCWLSMTGVDDLGVGAVANSYGTGPVSGFVHRELQALITVYLQGSTFIIPSGLPAGSIMTGGDFLCTNTGAGQAQPGMKAYANFSNGAITFAATGSPTGGASATGSTIGAETNGATGTIVGNVFTAVSGLSGTFYPGTTLSGTGVASGTQIVSQLSGTPGGLGTYAVSISEQAVTSTAITGTYGLLTIGTATGTFAVNDLLTVSGSVAAGTVITANVTGSGGTAGTMIVNNNTGVTSQTISVAAVNVETKWYAMSFGNTGELVKISDHATG